MAMESLVIGTLDQIALEGPQGMQITLIISSGQTIRRLALWWSHDRRLCIYCAA